MTIITNTTDRKALAKAIADELGTTAKFMGVPSFGYQIGEYIVDRAGNINGEDFEALRDFLQRNGYEIPAQETTVEATEEPETECPAKEDAPADIKAEPVTSMDISIPAHGATIMQLKNLIFMLHSRQTLINRMTESDCLYIPDILIDRLKEIAEILQNTYRKGK